MATEPFGYCLNTSTIRGQALSLVDELKLTAEVGYRGVEPWIEEIDRYVEQGGSLSDLAKLIQDLGLSVESAIGFFEWIVDDAALRAKGMAEARRNMELVAQLGGQRIATPPFGAHEDDANAIDLFQVAQRYHDLLQLGDQIGVVPMVELWGFSKNLSRLGEVALVAVECRHLKANLLLDVYHLHKGGSDSGGLRRLRGEDIGLFHYNDYPLEPGRDTITDADRVYPGDGVAPLGAILRDLHAGGYRGMLSLELFNEDYWKQHPKTILQTGLDKMRATVRESL